MCRGICMCCSYCYYYYSCWLLLSTCLSFRPTKWEDVLAVFHDFFPICISKKYASKAPFIILSFCISLYKWFFIIYVYYILYVIFCYCPCWNVILDALTTEPARVSPVWLLCRSQAVDALIVLCTFKGTTHPFFIQRSPVIRSTINSRDPSFLQSGRWRVDLGSEHYEPSRQCLNGFLHLKFVLGNFFCNFSVLVCYYF